MNTAGSRRSLCGKAVLATLAAITLLLSASAHSKLLDAFLDTGMFGSLDQGLTNCPQTGCGPTAAVNSFVWLQKKYPSVYRGSLVPSATAGGPTTEEMKATANILGINPYMASCLPCGPGAGTLIEDFIIGKNAYLEAKAPGKTRYQAQMNFAWRENPAGGTHLGTKKPAWVQDSTKPTPGFLYTNLKHGEDIELFVGGPSDEFGHYLTLTGIHFDDVANTGYLSFIDPLGGAVGTADITGFHNGYIETSYKLHNAASGLIYHAVVESPVPEPATMALLLAGLVLMLLYRTQTALTIGWRPIRQRSK